jgi:capsular exopolysaccharide synthesis family protein
MENNSRKLSYFQVEIKELFNYYLRNWYSFILSILISITIAYFKIKTTVSIYEVKSTILVKDEQKSNLNSQFESIENLGFNIGSINSKLENEIEILKSRTLVSKVVKELKLNITCFQKKKYKDHELYKTVPFTINFLKGDSILNNTNKTIEFKIIDKNTILFTEVINNSIKHQKIKFGTLVSNHMGDFIITPTKNWQKFLNIPIIYQIEKFNTVVENVQKSIIIETVEKESSIINLSIQIENIDKGKNILNTLVKLHSIDAINDKNQIATNTLNFINERLNYITNELSNVESNVSNFKSNNNLLDISTNTNIFIQNENENAKKIVETATQIKLAEFIYEFVINKKQNELIPSNLGFTNSSLEKMIETINVLQLEKNKIENNYGEKNPILINLNNEINILKKNLIDGLASQINTLKINFNFLNNQKKDLLGIIHQAPSKEKEFKEIFRQQQIKESLYLFLLHKREETSISLAVTTPNTKIIDSAYSDEIIKSPKKKIIFAISLIIGMFIPFTFLFIKKLLDTKIHSKDDIINLGLPYLGDLPLEKNKNNSLIVNQGERTSIAEAFKIIRTNINFYTKNNNSLSSKIIFISSTISHEGKSFISLNLASTIGLTDKKVLLIGMDLRAPKLLEYLDIKNQKGVTSFIIDNNLTINDIITKIPNTENVDIIPSGPIPPNPSELLMSDRIKELFEEAKKQYDYIIVDTAPVGMVTDTLLISDYADIFIYVTRAHYLEKNLLSIPETLYNEKKIKNMAVLLNGTDQNKGYGYGYGYGYGNGFEKEKKWYTKIFTK